MSCRGAFNKCSESYVPVIYGGSFESQASAVSGCESTLLCLFCLKRRNFIRILTVYLGAIILLNNYRCSPP